ncbi:putative baseplate assembly protein [Catellatospora sp. NPDC049111]|uniref:putative baseplate assembly protein n=1 Tax=Catellatospora sp. NPDC049111 TaxID=3155271 RepID=UPI0033D225B1
MTDQTPMFDDRTFSELADQARRRFAERLDELGAARRDPNAAEDAVLTACALVVDELVHRLNRVGEQLRGPMLHLLGLRPRPAGVARTHVRFWFPEPLSQPLDIPRGVQIATDSGVSFTTTGALRVNPARIVATALDGDGGQSLIPQISDENPARPFGHSSSGAALLVGLAEPAPGAVVALSMTWSGGAVPAALRQETRWQCWDGAGWRRCFVRPGSQWLPERGSTLLLDIPTRHVVSTIAGRRAAWLRWQPARAAVAASLPPLHGITAAAVGATVGAVHARRIADEPLGVLDGEPEQRLRLRHPPVVVDIPGQATVVETDAGDGWLPWTVVADFADSGPEDRHVVLDQLAGELRFGPAVREVDGRTRRYGAAAPTGALVRIRGYWVGGGVEGNVDRGALRRLRTPLPIPGVLVENLYPATGGTQAETEQDLWVRAPLAVQAGGRAVTGSDYEYLARTAAPHAARVHCVAATSGELRLLVIPALTEEQQARPAPEQLQPSADMLAAIADHLEPRRVMGVHLVVEPPHYQGISVLARISAGRGADPAAVTEHAVDALYAYLHPLTGGRDGSGWPLGHPVSASELMGVLHRVDGVTEVHDVELYAVDLASGAQDPAISMIELVPTALLLSVDHHVQVSTA